MPSFIIVGYAWQILGRGVFLPPHPWAVPKRPILNKEKSWSGVRSNQVFQIYILWYKLNGAVVTRKSESKNYLKIAIFGSCVLLTKFRNWWLSRLKASCISKINSLNDIFSNSQTWSNLRAIFFWVYKFFWKVISINFSSL